MAVECVVENGIAKIVIDRPKALNALNSEVLQGLKNAIAELQNRTDVRVLLIQGGGDKSFVAGADIAQMSSLNPLEGSEFGRLGQSVFSSISELPFPTIAVIQGFALGGGCEIALACDIRIASEKAKFGQPEVGLGIFSWFWRNSTISSPRRTWPSEKTYLQRRNNFSGSSIANRPGRAGRCS